MLLIAFFIGLSFAGSSCPSTWMQVGNQCYWYSGSILRSWNDASTYCNSIGSNLASTYNVSILNAAELLITSNNYLTWTGLYKDGSSWNFVDKTYFYSSLWATGEPNAGRGNCGAIRKATDQSQNGYVATGCSYSQPFLCSQRTASCISQNFTATKGSLSSPNYPSNYANYENCAQFIVAPSGYFVELTFDVWIVEKNYDYVLLYDGFASDPASQLMVNITIDPTNATVSPIKNSFQTQSNVMSVIFRSDSVVNYKGWHANYVQKAYTPTVYQNGTGSTVTSPNYPMQYPNNVEQYIYVSSPNLTQILGTFSYFDTELNKDYLVIYDGPDKNSTVIGNYSGHSGIPNPFQTTSNCFTLYFETDYSLTYKGFSLDWTIF